MQLMNTVADSLSRSDLKLSAQRNETVTKQFQNIFKTVLKLFCFSFVSLCGQFKPGHYTIAIHFGGFVPSSAKRGLTCDV